MMRENAFVHAYNIYKALTLIISMWQKYDIYSAIFLVFTFLFSTMYLKSIYNSKNLLKKGTDNKFCPRKILVGFYIIKNNHSWQARVRGCFKKQLFGNQCFHKTPTISHWNGTVIPIL